MTQKDMLYIAGALVLGYLIGSGKLKKGATGATAHNETPMPADWWSYAGSWAV